MYIHLLSKFEPYMITKSTTLSTWKFVAIVASVAIT